MSNPAGLGSVCALNRMMNKSLSILFLLLCVCPHASAQAEKQTAYAILLDNTGSLRTQFDQVKRLAKGVIQEVHQRGPVTLFNFKPGAKPKDPIVPRALGDQWSQDAAQLVADVDKLTVEPGQTPLFDAIDSISEELSAKAALEKETIGRKIFILISDGEDRISKLKRDELIKRLKQKGVEVYAVGLVGALDKEGGIIRKSKRETAEDFLRKVTKETGGRLLLPKAKDEEVNAFIQGLVAAR